MTNPYNTRSMANHLSGYGRYGDDQLVHMNRHEVAMLDGIASAFGRQLTRNPHTGMKEAFNLFDVLPIALNFIPGIGTAASIALSAASGAASSAIEGGNPLEGALMGGLTGAVGASLGGGADAAAKAGTDATTKAATDAVSTAGINVSPELLAEGVTAADIAGMASNAGPQFAAGATGAPASILPGTTSAAASPGMFTDVFGAGTDKQVSDALQSIWKKENLPYTIMGGTALSMLPDMFASEGPGRPEYKDIPENFPGRPRMVNPDYDPTMSAFGEQNAFSSGVDYLGRGYAEGGEVDKGGGFNPMGMIGGVIPMIIDGFTDGNKYGSGILGMLFNKRKPWEYGKDDAPQGMANAPMASTPSLPAPGYAFGGPVQNRRSENGIAEYYRNLPIIRQIPSRGNRGGKGGAPAEMPEVFTPRQRNIQPTNMANLFAGRNPLLRDVAPTSIPLPAAMNFRMPQFNPAPMMPPMMPAKGGEQPQINPGMAYGGMVRGYADGGMVDQAPQVDDQSLVKEAIMALMGQSPNAEAVIAMFVDRFGEGALELLMSKIKGDEDGRYMQGPGDGLSDSIPAMVDGQQPSALSSGEFVVPADAVSHLGNGSNEAGAKELYGMIDRVRQARTGTPESPPAINQRGIMPA